MRTRQVCSVAFLAAVGLAQQQPSVTKPAGQLQRRAEAPARTIGWDRRITLDVTVFDKGGKQVSDLREGDFTVLVDKHPQKLVSFAAVDRKTAPGASPAKVVLVLDEINASFEKVAAARQGLKEFLRHDQGKLSVPASLVIASGTETMTSDRPSLDGNVLMAELDRKPAKIRVFDRSQAEHGATEQLRLSLLTMERIIKHEAADPRRKLVVWISPGWPFMPRNAPEPDPESKREMLDLVVALSDGLRQARITLYAVNPTGVDRALDAQAVHYKEFLKGVNLPGKVESGHFSLPVLAIQSGGLALDRSNDLARDIAKCVADADLCYTLSFDAPEQRGPVEHREIAVEIAKPGLTARTRTGYYSPF